MDGRFQPGDTRINRRGRPKKRSLAEAIGAVISADDAEKIASEMKILALAGDVGAAQAVAALAAVGLGVKADIYGKAQYCGREDRNKSGV